ncbi:MAG: DUF4139 domain-containing protein [Phycisphaerales bacterium]|nr:DUF4139 domain-containing protein [Phycisphaerales bacterium]
MMKRTLAAMLALAGLATPVVADQTALTIYSSAEPGGIPPEMYRPTPPSPFYNPYQNQPLPGYAVVKQERRVQLVPGRSVVRFTDVAAYIDPTTVAFESLTSPAGTRVLEQNYQFDLVSNQKLLERFLDQTISIDQVAGGGVKTVTGKLLSAAGGVILQQDDGTLVTLNGYSSIHFPALPSGLITRPTLVWDVSSAQGGEQDARVTYQTTGITWWADYNLVFSPGENANSGLLDVGAWVSIVNQSGATYDDARLKLVAGDVHRAPRPQVYGGGREMLSMARGGAVAEEAGFQEKSFFEYHLYTLGRPTTLPDNSTKQIELFEAAKGVPAEKVLVYSGLAWPYGGWWPSPALDRDLGIPMSKEVDVYLKFKNSKEHGLGMPMPKGRIRVNQVDADDGSMEFIGEDVIDHTPKDETVLINMGEAFDVVGERRQVDFRVDLEKDWLDETIEIKVRNHKAEPVNVIVRESLYRWANWNITKKSQGFEKQDSRTVHFPVTIAPDGEAVVTYTVHYNW